MWHTHARHVFHHFPPLLCHTCGSEAVPQLPLVLFAHLSSIFSLSSFKEDITSALLFSVMTPDVAQNKCQMSI